MSPPKTPQMPTKTPRGEHWCVTSGDARRSGSSALVDKKKEGPRKRDPSLQFRCPRGEAEARKSHDS